MEDDHNILLNGRLAQNNNNGTKTIENENNSCGTAPINLARIKIGDTSHPPHNHPSSGMSQFLLRRLPLVHEFESTIWFN